MFAIGTKIFSFVLKLDNLLVIWTHKSQYKINNNLYFGDLTFLILISFFLRRIIFILQGSAQMAVLHENSARVETLIKGAESEYCWHFVTYGNYLLLDTYHESYFHFVTYCRSNIVCMVRYDGVQFSFFHNTWFVVKWVPHTKFKALGDPLL